MNWLLVWDEQGRYEQDIVWLDMDADIYVIESSPCQLDCAWERVIDYVLDCVSWLTTASRIFWRILLSNTMTGDHFSHSPKQSQASPNVALRNVNTTCLTHLLQISVLAILRRYWSVVVVLLQKHSPMCTIPIVVEGSVSMWSPWMSYMVFRISYCTTHDGTLYKQNRRC